MCSNYRPVTRSDVLLKHFGIVRPEGELPIDAYPSYLAPFIRRARHKTEYSREAELGQFGLIPHWAKADGKDVAMGKKRYNARSETVAQLASYRDAWRKGQRCIVPAHWIHEPNYETGKHVKWRIGLQGWVPFGIAGIWAWWRNPVTDTEVLSFSMLTVNADTHDLMKRFHKPGEEKRMVVILDEADYDSWLHSSVEEAAKMFTQYPAELMDALPLPQGAMDASTERGGSDP